MRQNVPILVYHHVYKDSFLESINTNHDSATGMIKESEFRLHLNYIMENNWSVISTNQLSDWIEGKVEIPEKSVVLHFDNGWLDTFTIAMPIVRELGITATCYVISDATEAASKGLAANIRTSTEGSVKKRCIDWKQTNLLLEMGWEIGAHTATHPKLVDLLNEHGEEGVMSEIEKSNKSYLDNLGFIPIHFAYPSGSNNIHTDRLLGDVYQTLRLWEFNNPPTWSFTNGKTSSHGLKSQNLDSTVSFSDFVRIFHESEVS